MKSAYNGNQDQANRIMSIQNKNFQLRQLDQFIPTRIWKQIL